MIKGKEKATIFLSIIGPQKAARLLRQLPEDVSNLLAAKVATLSPPSPKVVSSLLDEMSSNLLPAPQEEEVKEIEDNAEKEEIVSNVEDIKLQIKNNDFSNVSAATIADIIKNENVRIINMVLNLVGDDKSNEVKSILELNRKQKLEIKELEPSPILDEIKDIILDKIIQNIEA